MRPIPSVDPASVRRVVMIRPRFLGDICLTLPTLDAVRAACPQARIAYILERGLAPLLEGDPRVDALLATETAPNAAATAKLIAKIRAFRPDVALDFFCNPRTAVWIAGSGARVRVGYPNKGWRSSLYTHHARPRTLSAIGFHLASLEALGWPAPDGVPALHIREAARLEARRALAALGIPDDAALVGFHPGARWMTRRWDPERFAELARRYLEAHPRGVALVTGGPGEERLTLTIQRAIGSSRAHAVAGWPVQRFVALQSLCAAFVCGDTGPLHTSVAAGAPTLGLMTRNRPAMFFPYPASHGHRACYARVPCSPCHRDICDDLRCLRDLTVDGVWKTLASMLEARTASPVPEVAS